MFGKKDYQQLFIIRSMVEQLNLPVRIIGSETRREADGLAMSSRNQYLSPVERARAVGLYRTLSRVKQELEAGRLDYAALEREAGEQLVGDGFRVDYVAVRKVADLMPPSTAGQPLVILAAAWLGATRLIDNLEACVAG